MRSEGFGALVDEIERLRRLADERGREIEKLQNEIDGPSELMGGY